jgi:hypothetical protein
MHGAGTGAFGEPVKSARVSRPAGISLPSAHADIEPNIPTLFEAVALVVSGAI